ncbi:7-cyano-7-deazaguanine synthase [Alteromonas sp. KUL49]|uniref:7-cyano-7-deazaguanine synthase n=1 Tax=Alteromonas sp. KUL49 TaxID=2480798 RepID=UPI00102F29EB|nr:7-cyano-7-deazaguanine synthase [Alteromonas sp. KUL49]TAP40763.1 asparagine synthase [Alteromonas sp. KUL49]GEA10932.1 hypothetical protein KUL49_13070 [Alteromonas sp. KUL49]
MSKLFGVYRKEGLTPTLRSFANKMMDDWCDIPDGQLNHYFDKCFGVIQKDYQQYQQSGWNFKPWGVGAMAGHSVVSSDREKDLIYLSDGSPLKDDKLREIEGSCCLFSYNKHSTTLELATDPLGLRPFYFMEVDGGLVFCTDVKTFSKLNVHLTPNKDALCEYATLGYFLLDHTPFKEVHCSTPAQKLKTDVAGNVQLDTYFDWKELTQSKQSVDDAILGIDKDFKSVCDRYLANDSSVLTTLSGGLDSRLIACELKRRQLDIVGFNFSQKDTQDVYCAKQFSEANELDISFVQVKNTQSLSVEMRLGEYWREQRPKGYEKVDRPQLSWSGNGGSVGLGYIYFSDPVYRAALTQNVEKLADAYLSQQFACLPQSVVVDAREYQSVLRENIIKALSLYNGVPLEKAYYLFLLHNDQHHHLAIPNEDIDKFQMEFCLPIYSWKVLRHILSLPVEEVRRHKFYLRWLKQSYPEALKTPWQAYPGHIPCPHKIQAKDQWSVTKEQGLPLNRIVDVWQKSMKLPVNNFVKRSSFTFLCVLHCLKVKKSTSQINFVNKIVSWH